MVIIVQVLGKYMIIRYLDPWGKLPCVEATRPQRITDELNSSALFS